MITMDKITEIPVCHNLRRYANKVFKGITTNGKISPLNSLKACLMMASIL